MNLGDIRDAQRRKLKACDKTRASCVNIIIFLKLSPRHTISKVQWNAFSRVAWTLRYEFSSVNESSLKIVATGCPRRKIILWSLTLGNTGLERFFLFYFFFIFRVRWLNTARLVRLRLVLRLFRLRRDNLLDWRFEILIKWHAGKSLASLLFARRFSQTEPRHYHF